MTKRARKTFSKDSKEQMVQLHSSGKPCAEIIRIYKLTPSSLQCAVSCKLTEVCAYEAKTRDDQEGELTNQIVDIFKKSRQNYGQKIKVELKKLGWTVSDFGWTNRKE